MSLICLNPPVGCEDTSIAGGRGGEGLPQVGTSADGDELRGRRRR
jgi:hypothetical protein